METYILVNIKRTTINPTKLRWQIKIYKMSREKNQGCVSNHRFGSTPQSHQKFVMGNKWSADASTKKPNQIRVLAETPRGGFKTAEGANNVLISRRWSRPSSFSQEVETFRDDCFVQKTLPLGASLVRYGQVNVRAAAATSGPDSTRTRQNPDPTAPGEMCQRGAIKDE